MTLALTVAGADEREARGEVTVQALDGEDLIAVGPQEAAQHTPGRHVDGVHSGLASVRIEPGRVATKPGDHAAGADERTAAREEKAAGPAVEADDGLEPTADDPPQLAVTTVVDPDVAAE